MTKKQPYINKKEARSFALVHKGQEQPGQGRDLDQDSNSHGRVFVETTVS